MNKLELKQIISTYDRLLDTSDYLELMGYTDVHHEHDFKICCPIHEETEPSFSYSQSLGIWTCFGACHTSGKVTKLHYMLMRKEYGDKISIVNALKDLHTLFPHILPNINLESKAIQKNSDTKFLESVAKYKDSKIINPNIISKDIDINDYMLLEYTSEYRKHKHIT